MDAVTQLQKRVAELEAERDMLRMLFAEQRRRAAAANQSYYTLRDWMLARFEVKLPADLSPDRHSTT